MLHSTLVWVFTSFLYSFSMPPDVCFPHYGCTSTNAKFCSALTWIYYWNQGFILTSEIDGTIQMKSYLSGNPEVRLALNEDLSIGRSGRSICGIVCFPRNSNKYLYALFSILWRMVPPKKKKNKELFQSWVMLELDHYNNHIDTPTPPYVNLILDSFYTRTYVFVCLGSWRVVTVINAIICYSCSIFKLIFF